MVQIINDKRFVSHKQQTRTAYIWGASIFCICVVTAQILSVASDQHASSGRADVVNIIADLRSMKAASLMFYADSKDEIESKFNPLTSGNNHVEFLKPYLDYPDKYTKLSRYRFEIEGSKWWVGYDLKGKDALNIQYIRDKLKGGNARFGFFGEKSLDVRYDGQDVVWMLVK